MELNRRVPMCYFIIIFQFVIPEALALEGSNGGKMMFATGTLWNFSIIEATTPSIPIFSSSSLLTLARHESREHTRSVLDCALMCWMEKGPPMCLAFRHGREDNVCHLYAHSSTATGPAPDVPVFLFQYSKVCGQTLDPGDGVPYMPVHGYDLVHGVCESFLYSGFDGNANRFQDEATCNEVCIAKSMPVPEVPFSP